MTQNIIIVRDATSPFPSILWFLSQSPDPGLFEEGKLVKGQRTMMKTTRSIAILIALLISQVFSGCAPKQPAEPTLAPTSEPTPTTVRFTPAPTLEPTATVVVLTDTPTVEATKIVAPADVDARRKEVLDYITNLSAGPFAGVISGQNSYHGTEILDQSAQHGYSSMVVALHAKTKKWVGILGVDYEFAKIFTPQELSQTNQVLMDYANAGGLVSITLTPLNPWVNDEADLESNPGTWDGLAGSQNSKSFKLVTNLDDLIDPDKAVNAAWMRKLDRIAAALQELRDAGVIVLFRPMQEMNGNWFWWGMQSHPKDPAPYVHVYQQMHDYFTNTKKLNNLIWVYSPNASMGQNNSSSWNRTVNWAYPGDSYVDIVAGTNYDDNMILADYATYVSMKKPLGIAELGPKIGGPAAKNGTWDTSKIITKIKNNYPKISYWVSWHSYPQQCWSLISNLNADALMNDPAVITRDDFKWSWVKP
jgi:mannan endo-1,4-beta-mannosidase